MLTSLITRRELLRAAAHALAVNKTNVTAQLYERIDQYRNNIPDYSPGSNRPQPIYYRNLSNGRGEFVVSSGLWIENMEVRIPAGRLGSLAQETHYGRPLVDRSAPLRLKVSVPKYDTQTFTDVDHDGEADTHKVEWTRMPEDIFGLDANQFVPQNQPDRPLGNSALDQILRLNFRKYINNLIGVLDANYRLK